MMAKRGFVDESLLAKVPSWRNYLAAKLGFRNHWYPVRFSREVQEGQVVAAILCGEKILMRRIDGRVYTLKDRCIHRGVNFSDKIECYTKNTLTCWYHGFTYKWDTGELCDILALPDSKAIGRRHVKVYPTQEAKGLIFVFLGDPGVAPHPLSEDVPPTFLDDDLSVHGASYDVAANWRVGCENGFDGLHVYIHRTSALVPNTQRSLPIGHTAKSESVHVYDQDGAPKGVYDSFSNHTSIWDGSIQGQVVVKGIRRVTEKPTRTTAASLWLPCVLRVDDFPDQQITTFEWYVPETEGSHRYMINVGKRVSSEAERTAFEHEFWHRWKPLGFEDFNAQDVTARLSLQKYYQHDEAWLEEGLVEGDMPLIKWRELCHRANRGLQTPGHLL